MANSFYGSIDFSKLIELAKAKNPAFTKSDANGKIYLNVQIFIKDEADKFGNKLSLRTSYKGAQGEDKHYFGNCKESENTANPVSSSDIPDENDFDF